MNKLQFIEWITVYNANTILSKFAIYDRYNQHTI